MHAIIANLHRKIHSIVRKMSTDHFKGVPLKEVYRGQEAWSLDHLPPIANKRDHIVLYQLPLTQNMVQPPTPHRGDIKWDAGHVRLPCATQNEYKTESGSDPSKTISASRWEIIQTALLRDIRSSRELERAILSYNTKYSKEWKFRSLHALFEEELDESEATAFFSMTLPNIIQLALQLPDIVPSAIPLLKRGQNKSISLSQKQIACLLANAFLCTFPRRNDYKSSSEYASYPSINFNSLFQSNGDQNIHKIKCICNYFRRVCHMMPSGVVTFTRRSIPETDFPEWSHCETSFANTLLHVSDSGTIEDDGEGLLQVDFANKFLGGGVLNYGCVQEEIRFMICPELLVSRLFTEHLDDNECMIIMGCERFNSYSGYASSFEWVGDYMDKTPFDTSRRRKCTIVAIDAVPFRSKSQQYKEEMLKRELNKAYIGFKHDLNTPAPGVATGNWGCGAFNGNKHLKSLIQLMACCVNKRPLVYYTFGDEHLRDELYMIHEYLSANKVTIAELWTCLRRYAERNHNHNNLYEFIIAFHQELRERKSSTNGQSSTQVNRSEDKSTEKLKRNQVMVELAKRKSKVPPIAHSTDDNIEVSDEDDEQFSIDETMNQLQNTLAEHRNTSSTKLKPQPSQDWITTRKPKKTIGSSGSHTISNFFNNSTSTNEIQEKRPRSSLLESLDEDYNRKSPAKRHATMSPAPANDLNQCQRMNSSVVDDDNENLEKKGSFSACSPVLKHQESHDHNNDAQTLDHNDQLEMSEDLFDDLDDIEQNESDKSSNNPSWSFEESNDYPQDEIVHKTPESDCNDTSAMSTDIFEDAESEPKIDQTTEQNNKSVAEGNKDSPLQKKGTDRSRQMFENFFIKTPRSTAGGHQSSPSNRSTSDGSTADTSFNEIGSASKDDRENSDLKSEADQLEALHVASEK